MSYTQHGSGRTRVFFLHGWGSSSALWGGLPELVAASPEYTAIVPDLPGFGDTPEPQEGYTVSDCAEIVREFILSFGTEDCILIGHSYGGRVIIKLASEEQPFGILKIILFDSAGLVPARHAKDRLRNTVTKSARALLPSKTAERLKNKFGSDDYRNASPTMRKTLVFAVNEDLREHLPKITAPTLLFWGELDTATPIADGRVMESLIPDAGLVVAQGAGHFSYLDAPVLAEKVVRSFLTIKESAE
ncbi:MAG: alpha/beta hydrolase [Oscillospiraceae bacterium]|nr:alpha/beta hydrolase [Oscillospiraceae bacterium]